MEKTNNKISEKQFFTLTASFFMGNALALAGGVSGGEKIGYITLFASYALFLLLCLLYFFLFKKSKSSDLYTVCESIFGSFFGKIALFVVFLYSVFTALLSSAEFMLFSMISSDFKINPLVISLVFSFSLLGILLCGKKALARYSELILPFVIACIAFVLISGAGKFDLSNLRTESVPSAGFIFSNIYMNFITPFSNVMLIYFFASDNKKSAEKSLASGVKGGFTALLVIAAVYVSNLLIIGKSLMGTLFFPTLFTFGVINPPFLAERSEAIFFISYIFFDILYTAVAYFTAADCFQRIFCKKASYAEKTDEKNSEKTQKNDEKTLKIEKNGQKNDEKNRKNDEKKQKTTAKILYILAAALSLAIMNLNTEAEKFYSAFSYLPYVFSAVTLGLPLLLALTLTVKACFAHAWKNNSHRQ